MRRPFLILQHAETEGPGLLAEPIAAAGHPLRLVRTDRGEPVPADAGGLAGIIVMGGPMGVGDALRHPHLAAEIALLRQALERDLPVLGVCLGAQILASAAGAALLASSARYRHQAFRAGRRAWGLQFHVEVTPEMVDDFVTANAGELAGVHGAGAGERLSAEARRFAPLLAPAVPRLVEDFLRAAAGARRFQDRVPPSANKR